MKRRQKLFSWEYCHLPSRSCWGQTFANVCSFWLDWYLPPRLPAGPFNLNLVLYVEYQVRRGNASWRAWFSATRPSESKPSRTQARPMTSRAAPPCPRAAATTQRQRYLWSCCRTDQFWWMIYLKKPWISHKNFVRVANCFGFGSYNFSVGLHSTRQKKKII